MSIRIAVGSALCLVLAGGHVTARAQDRSGAMGPDDETATAPFDTLTIIGTRTERALGDVAATVSVKTAGELERELTRDIADLVRFEPGVTVSGTASRFGLGGFTIRGIGGNRVLTLVDGVTGGVGASRERPDPQDVDIDNVVAKVALHPNEAHELTFAVDTYDNRTDTRVLSDYGEITSGTVTDRRDAADTRDRTRVSLNYRYRDELVIADDLDATLYRQRSDSRQVTAEDRTTAAGDPQARLRVSTFEQDIDGAILQLGKSIETGSAGHLLTYGVDYYATENASLRDGGSFDATGAPVFEFLPLPTRDFPQTEVRQLAFFLQDEIGLLGERLLLSPGLRYDRFDADASADEIYLSGNPGSPAPEDYDDSEVTAKIGALYAFSDAFSAFARYSEGFRAPPYGDVNVGFTNFIAGYKTIANPDLESEQSSGVEVGVRWHAEDGSLSLAAYRNEYDNFIESFAIAPEFLATGGIDPADGLLTFQSINRDEVEISGAELGGTLALGAVNDRLTRFSVRAAVAYAEGEDRESGAPINSIEPLTAVIGLGYESRDDAWGAELIWTLAGDKDPADIDATLPQMPTGGYGVLDLLAHLDISERVHLNAGLFNVLDKTYLRWADTAAMGVDAPARFTQPGFNAGATLRVEW